MSNLIDSYFGKKVLIIAEVAQAHEGSLGIAHSYIDAIADTGADMVKFQTHIANEESTKNEPWRVKFSYQDKDRYSYWKRMEFSLKDWGSLKEHAEKKGLIFLSSPFSLKALKILKKIKVDILKVASGELNNTILLNEMIKTRLPILISTGMSKLEEIDEIAKILKENSINFALFQCTSLYPTPPERVGLNLLNFYKERYNCPVGFSDHSGKIYTSLAAVALGAKFIEVHVTFHKKLFGPDVSSSLTLEELSMVVEGARYIEKIIENPISKTDIPEEIKEIKSIFQKSIVAKRNLEEGTILTEKDICLKKPGNGLPPKEIKNVLGKKTKRFIRKDEIIKFEDLL